MALPTIAAAVFLVVGALALAACGGGGDEGEGGTTEAVTTSPSTETAGETTPTTTAPEGPERIRVVVEGGVPKGGIARRTVAKNDRVLIVVRSDVADEVHVHGYDVARNVPAGGTVRVAFTADLPGRFEVELEERGAQIAELTVEP
jgi:hypothetical protein